MSVSRDLALPLALVLASACKSAGENPVGYDYDGKTILPSGTGWVYSGFARYGGPESIQKGTQAPLTMLSLDVFVGTIQYVYRWDHPSHRASRDEYTAGDLAGHSFGLDLLLFDPKDESGQPYPISAGRQSTFAFFGDQIRAATMFTDVATTTPYDAVVVQLPGTETLFSELAAGKAGRDVALDPTGAASYAFTTSTTIGLAIRHAGARFDESAFDISDQQKSRPGVIGTSVHHAFDGATAYVAYFVYDGPNPEDAVVHVATFDGATWADVAQTRLGRLSGSPTALRVLTGAGRVFLRVELANDTKVLRLEGGSLVVLPSPPESIAVRTISIAVGPMGEVLYGFSDPSHEGRATIAAVVGNTLVPVGQPGFTAVPVAPQVFSANGDLYVALVSDGVHAPVGFTIACHGSRCLKDLISPDPPQTVLPGSGSCRVDPSTCLEYANVPHLNARSDCLTKLEVWSELPCDRHGIYGGCRAPDTGRGATTKWFYGEATDLAKQCVAEGPGWTPIGAP